MQRSDSALLRSAPGTSGFRCWEYGGRAPGIWARGSVLEGTPVPDFSGPPLSHDALVNLKYGIAKTHRQRYREVEEGIPPLPSSTADPFAKSSRILRSPPSRPHSETPPSAMASCAPQESGTPVVSDQF
ncbi:hypothetical protein J6590_038396 [Homalodisca vitripennis]|nr:hypothetical protein J6590_038396 [Homalodisca vitripennis]